MPDTARRTQARFEDLLMSHRAARARGVTGRPVGLDPLPAALRRRSLGAARAGMPAAAAAGHGWRSPAGALGDLVRRPGHDRVVLGPGLPGADAGCLLGVQGWNRGWDPALRRACRRRHPRSRPRPRRAQSGPLGCGRPLPAADRAHAHRRHRRRHRPRPARPGRAGTGGLRLGRGPHFPRPQDARLQPGRHPVHAGER